MVGLQPGAMGILPERKRSGKAAGTVWRALQTKDNAEFDCQGLYV